MAKKSDKISSFLFHEPENLKSELVFKADRIILSVQKLE